MTFQTPPGKHMTPNMIDQNGTLKGMIIIPILTQKISNVDFKHSIVKREV